LDAEPVQAWVRCGKGGSQFSALSEQSAQTRRKRYAPGPSRWFEYRRKSFIRPNGNVKPRANAHLSIRHDAYRFMPPGAPRHVGKDVVPYFWPDHGRTEQTDGPEDIGPAEAAADLAALLSLKRELDVIRAEMKFRRVYAEIMGRLRALRDGEVRKAFNPNQPRVPAGSREGGQWASGTGSSVGRNDSRVISDAIPDGVRTGARYAEARKPGGYPLDLRDEEARGGHAVAEHVGKSPQSLLASLRERNLAIITRGDSADGLSVGSFSSLEAANKLVNSTLSQNPDIVDQVATGRLSATTVTARFGSVTGYEAYARTERSQPYLRETYGVEVVIRHDPIADKGYHVVTAFPKF
jgi:hypothetical protein